MLLSKVAFSLCLLLLLCTWAAQVTATRNKDKRRLHGLHLVTLGLSLSACAYLIHIMASSGSPALFSLVFRVGGMTFLWLAWRDHWTQQHERRMAQATALRQERDEAHGPQTILPPVYREVYLGLNSLAREVLCAAQEEALHRRCCCVDTDHLLLGLLQMPHCAASRILERSEVSSETLMRALAGPPDAAGQSGTTEDGVPAAFTPRARQVLAMAEIEAHRFSKTFVGTEHLLLGLLLTGTGPAASALFASGMTVDAVRREVIAAGRLH